MASQWKDVDKYCNGLTQDKCLYPICKYKLAGSKNGHSWQDHCGNAATYPKIYDETKRVRSESRKNHGNHNTKTTNQQ